jgi:uncharacterized membrane protein YbhN (UPF0104 family)
LFAYVLLNIKIEEITYSFNVLGLNILILCLIVIIELVIKSIRFKFLISKIVNVSFKNIFKIILETALFVVYSPGRLGEIMKLDLLKQYGVKRTDSLAVLIVERVSDLIVITLFSLGIIFSFQLNFYPIIIVLVLILGFMIIFYKKNIFRNIIKQVFIAIKKIGNKQTILVICLTTPILWLMDAFIPYYILKMLGYNIGFQTVLFLYYAGTIVGLISMIPGGLGSFDFSFSFVLSTLTNVLKKDAIITIMITRIVAFIVCFIGIPLYFKDFKKMVSELSSHK